MPDRFEGDEVPDDAERVPPPLPRRDHLLHPVGKEERPHAVALPGGREGQHRRHLRGQPGLGAGFAEPGGPGVVHDEQAR